MCIEGVQRDEQRKGPDLLNYGAEDSGVDNLGQIGSCNESYSADDDRWNSEQVGFHSVESQLSKSQSQICLRWANRD